MIPRERRGRLYSILRERGINMTSETFGEKVSYFFPPAALGAYLGGQIYQVNPAYPTIILSIIMTVSLNLNLSISYMSPKRAIIKLRQYFWCR